MPEDSIDGREVVLVTYSHDSPEHAAKVKRLADQLRAHGVHAEIDQYVPAAGPPEGWPRWMTTMISEATWIVVVCTETYRRRFEGHEELGTGRGVTWEGAILQQLLYEAQSRNQKLVPVLFDQEPESSVPLVLRPYRRFHLPSGYLDLYAVLTRQGDVGKPTLGDRLEIPSPSPVSLPDAWSALGDPGAVSTRTRTPPPPPSATALEDLQQLLVALFSAEELRRLIRYMPDGERLSMALPGRGSSLLELSTAVVDTLQHHGAVDGDFFGRLARERERRIGEIRAVAERFGVAIG